MARGILNQIVFLLVINLASPSASRASRGRRTWAASSAAPPSWRRSRWAAVETRAGASRRTTACRGDRGSGAGGPHLVAREHLHRWSEPVDRTALSRRDDAPPRSHDELAGLPFVEPARQTRARGRGRRPHRGAAGAPRGARPGRRADPAERRPVLPRRHGAAVRTCTCRPRARPRCSCTRWPPARGASRRCPASSSCRGRAIWPRALGEVCGALPRRVGAELDVLPVAVFGRLQQALPQAAFEDVGARLVRQRAVKSAWEVQRIAAAGGARRRGGRAHPRPAPRGPHRGRVRRRRGGRRRGAWVTRASSACAASTRRCSTASSSRA